MRMTKPISAEDYKLLSSFEAVRKMLKQEKYADRLEKPLAYWTLPNDRRLPLAFLGRTIGDLLDTPFEELSATPGIGQKKINSLIKLLHRATKDHPPLVPFGVEESLEEADAAPAPQAAPTRPAKFDPSIVSEALWVQWRETVRKHDLGDEKLGHLAPSLQDLPTVIWNTPLSFYLDLTVAEIRQLRTHGEKRVRVVLEVFHLVHEMLSGAVGSESLAIRLAPRFTPGVEQWLDEVLAEEGAPRYDEVRERLVDPLLEQVERDAGPTVFQLAKGRLGLEGAPQSVRMQARKLGVTRARVYQLLDECSKVMEVRWPDGKAKLAQLADKFENDGVHEDNLSLFNAARELFYPTKYDEVEEPMYA